MNKQLYVLRILLNVALLGSVLFSPWWASISLAILLLVFWEAWEILLWGLLLDLLFGNPVPAYGNVTFLFTVVSFVLFSIAGVSKRRFIFYT